MGRAERRQAERSARIAGRKNNDLYTRKEAQEMKDKAELAVAKYDVEVLMTCFGIVLLDQYNFDHDQIMHAMQQIDDIFGQVLRDELNLEDVKQRLEDEAGVIVRG